MFGQKTYYVTEKGLKLTGLLIRLFEKIFDFSNIEYIMKISNY